MIRTPAWIRPAASGNTALSSSWNSAERRETIVRALLVGLLCVMPALVRFRTSGACVSDPDLGWQLASGQWIVQHHAMPHTDPFSRSVGGSPWQAYSWLFDLLLVALHGALGLKGFVILSVAMMGLITAAVWHMTSRLQSDFTVRMLLCAAAAVCLVRVDTPRPWLITMLFFVVLLDVLMQARRSGTGSELMWLPLLFAVWANVHIQFIDGLLVLGIAACEPLLARWWKSDAHAPPAWQYWLVLGASAGAACLNPYGAGIYRIAWNLASQPGVLDTISEMQSLPFRSMADYLLLFLALAAAGVLFRYRHLAPFETLLLAVAAVLSFRSRRDLWIMTFTACAILAAGLPVREARKDPGRPPRWASALSVLTWVGIFFAFAASPAIANQQLEASLANDMPVRAVAFLQQHHETGPLFNTYDWGGFLIWRLGEPVSMDGRAALYGDRRIARSKDTWGGAPDWADDPQLRSAGVVIAPHAAALTQLLRTDSRFAVAWEDPVATVFIARHQGIGAAASTPVRNPDPRMR